MKPLLLAVLALPLLASPIHAQPKEPTPEQAAFFESKVRPLLVAHCQECHGAKKQKGDVRLDSRAAILSDSELGPIVVPGQPDKSVLLRVMQHTGPIKMPPKGKLPAADLDTLAAWIKMGAPWPSDAVAKKANDAWRTHWAFQPIRKPTVPMAKEAASPIDAFLLAKLAEKGLKLSVAADPRTLLRRQTFDLVGLPPTPEEVETFVQEWNAPGSTPATRQSLKEKAVGRLLASPHHGERWGRHWLDVARYADTKGYVFFEEANFPWAYTYRDYVIRSFNEDKPFDRFVVEQLAADLLPLGDDRRPLTALGFLTLGGRFMNNAHDILDDRIDVATRGLMGLTMACARCHDHKYDPVSAKDYYGLYGVFANSVEATSPPLFTPPPQTDEYAKFEKELLVRERKLKEFVKSKHDELTTNARKRVAEYLLAAHALRDVPSTEDFMLIADGADLNPTMIVRWQKYLQRAAKKHDPVFAPWHALGALPEAELSNKTIGALDQLVQAKDRPLHSRVVQALRANPPKSMKDAAQQYATILHAVDKQWIDMLKADPKATRLPDDADEALRLVFHGLDAAANVTLLPYGDLSLLPDRASQGKLQELRKAMEQWRSTGKGAPARAHALEDLPTPVESHVFTRGNPNNRGDAAPRQLPAFLTGCQTKPFTQGSGRLELARAIASKDNPLTARVIVNRVWLHHFGQGLVRTPSDFGLRSDPPSHPELLDWLAATFIEDGWSLKKLHRRIVLSNAYSERSDDRPDAAAIDPENRLLWKMPRQRLDFEATRDSLLFVAGKLDRAVGGPSVTTPLATTANRRTLYSFLDRLNVPGLFRTFDFPSPDATSPQREDTTIAPQALFLMNHPFVMESARNVLRRPELAGEKNAGQRIERIHQLLFTRLPSPRERELATAYVQANGESAVAWERYVHALLQTNEFAWID